MNLGEVNEGMQGLQEWSLDSRSIVKNFAFANFKEALEFVNKVGEIAEKYSHHPDIMINANLVRLSLTSHNLGGLSKVDFDIAKEIDNL